MDDTKTTITNLKAQVSQFILERDWRQFHGAKNMSMNIAVEAAELLELFRWARNTQEIDTIMKEKRVEVEHELADVLFSTLAFADEYGIDLSTALANKIVHNAEKYPIEVCKGGSKKYDEY